MRKGFLVSVAAILGLTACAGLPILGQMLNQLSVSLGDEIPMPATLTLDLAPSAQQGLQLGNAILGQLGGGTIQQRLGQALQGQTQPLRRQGAALVRQQLQDAKIFGSVVAQGGNLGLSVGVSRLGLAYNASTGAYELVLDLEMKLSEPHLGVVWSGQRSAKDLGATVKGLAGRMDVAGLIARPDGFNNLAQAGIKDLSAQLLDDLKQHPPMAALGSLGGH
ncbi:MAG TPA: hypothetical protein VNZ67_02590 [bacterium]|jgi:hypothetical protein|nr:hypothetical protein [bacterium]